MGKSSSSKANNGHSRSRSDSTSSSSKASKGRSRAPQHDVSRSSSRSEGSRSRSRSGSGVMTRSRAQANAPSQLDQQQSPPQCTCGLKRPMTAFAAYVQEQLTNSKLTKVCVDSCISSYFSLTSFMMIRLHIVVENWLACMPFSGHAANTFLCLGRLKFARSP